MLELVAFVCGAAVMALEMTGSRLMAPHLGSSVLVWTALIGVILACLSVGYWLGGRLADKKPSARKLAGIILGAGFCVLILGYFQDSMLLAISDLRLRPELAAIIAALTLFGPASLLLGLVSPYIIRVAIAVRKIPVEASGAVIGRFYALSSLGSIIGTFLGGYVLISWVGSKLSVLLLAAALMAAAGLALLSDRKNLRGHLGLKGLFLTGIGLSVFVGMGQWGQTRLDEARGIYSIDTRYNRMLIMDRPNAQGRTLRVLETPPLLMQSAMFLDAPKDLALFYTRHFALSWQLKHEARRFLLMGGAGYSIPKYLLDTRRDISLDVVEIDPGMTRIAREFFALEDDPRLRIHHEDARTYLNRHAQDGASPKYDIIMGDTFSSVYNIPFHLSTVECARKIYDSLAPNGIFCCNLITSVTGETGQILRAMRATLAEVFPDVRIFPLLMPGNGGSVQNVMLMACKNPDTLGDGQGEARLAQTAARRDAGNIKAEAMDKEQEVARYMLKNEWKNPIPQDLPPMYDDFAPVERYALPLLY